MLVLGVLPPGQHVLVALVVGPLVQHPAATLHPHRVAAAEVRVHVHAVGIALVGAAQEVLVLVERDLKERRGGRGVNAERRGVLEQGLSLTHMQVQFQ